MPATINQTWSFAILTDLHIGRGYPDYAGRGANDAGSIGPDYYLTERLRKEVQHIIDVKNQYNIKFVAVLGDISDSGEYSELAKAKQILDTLNAPDLFYVPIMGNHDLWPEIDSDKPNIATTHNFYEVFQSQFDLLHSRMGVNWNQSWDQTAIPTYINYNFIVGGVRFLGLDFCSRDTLFRSTGFQSKSAEGWILKWLGLNDMPSILLSHIPMEKGTFLSNIGTILNFDEDDLDDLKREISNGKTPVLANFAGHVHGFYDPVKWPPIFTPFNLNFLDANKEYTHPDNPFDFPVVTTEALMVGSNIPDPKSPLRIINMNNNQIEDYNILNEGEPEARALNPYLIVGKPERLDWEPSDDVKILEGQKLVVFHLFAFTKRASRDYPLQHKLDFGDGESAEWNLDSPPGEFEAPKTQKHFYRGSTSGVLTASLTVDGFTPGGEKISEKFVRQFSL